MRELPLHKRFLYTYLSYLYWITYYTNKQRFLGIRLSSLVKFSTILLVLVAWIRGWAEPVLILSLLLMLFVFLAYWRAKRSGYFQFVPDSHPEAGDLDHAKLAPYERIAVKATGVFSLQEWEQSVLLCPAHYWQVPRGDHAVMVAYEPQRYLYQFFDIADVETIQRGWLLFGPHPTTALSISFISIWGPEFSQMRVNIFGSITSVAEPINRTIYLSFADAESERIVCHNILGDWQRYRREHSNEETGMG